MAKFAPLPIYGEFQVQASAHAQQDFAEDIPAFHALERRVYAVEADFGVNDRIDKALRHFLHGIGHVFHAAAERTDEAQLLLKKHHQVHGGGDTRG